MSGANFVQLLTLRAAEHSARDAVTFLREGEGEEQKLTYGELDLRARALAVRLLAEAAPGDRVLLLHPAGIEFVVAFMGCLYAGMVAVAAYPPRNPRHMARIESVLADAGARVILTVEEARAKILPWLGGRASEFCMICNDGVGSDQASDWRMPALTADTLALLQYSSGSTGTPRGVMVTHGNIMANEAMIQHAFAYHGQSRFVSWLPIYHDMGLIGNLLQPLYLGADTILMPPASFLQKPVRWLAAISRYRARTTGAPNFAFELCARAVTEDQKKDLDLSCLELIYNGSEPIDSRALERFATAFAGCGLKRKALQACYGMAECTLLATGAVPGAGPDSLSVDADELAANRVVLSDSGERPRAVLVNCGRSVAGQDLRIVDPASGNELPENRVGEIWLRGPHIAVGYWRSQEETRELMGARLQGVDGPFLRTGDLGFLRKGDLFVTGRIKDVIIVRGKNHYPQDIERTATLSHPALQPGSCSAFSVSTDAGEGLGLAAEIQRTAWKSLDGEAVAQAIRRAVADEHGLGVSAVTLLKPLTLPKTSSGKLQRFAARHGWKDGTLETVFEWREAVARPSAPSDPRAEEMLAWLRLYGETRINSLLMDQRRSIPPYIVLDFGNRGLLGLQAPLACGGAGLGYRDTLRVLEQLAAIDTNLSSFVGVHNALGLRPILRYGTDAMKAEVLPLLASGRELGCFAYTEPGAGSNPRAIQAKAVPDGEGRWKLWGEKKWIGTAGWAGRIVVFAHLLDPSGVQAGITAFLVRQDSPGLRQGAEELTMGMRGMVQNTVHLEGVGVRGEDILGEPGQGMVVAQDTMKFGRLCIAAASLGAMKRSLQIMVRYAERRSIGTGRLLDNVISRDRLTDLTTRVTALECLVGGFAGWLDQGLEVPEEMYALAKVAGPESLGLAADSLLQMLGGRGYIESNGASQLYRDARLLRIFEGPTETMLMFLGSRLASGSRPLEAFVRTTLRAPGLADELHGAAESAKRTHLGSSAGDPALGIQRVSQLLGEFGLWTLWLAVMEDSADKEAGARAVAWLRHERERSRARLTSPLPVHAEPLSPDDIVRLATGYVSAIGDVEQQCPGEEQGLDPWLRRSRPVSAESEGRPLSGPGVSSPPASEKPAGNLESSKSAAEVEAWLSQWIGHRLALSAARIDPLKAFADFGIDSLTAVELTGALGSWLGLTLPPTLTWDYPSLKGLAVHLGRAPASERQAASDGDSRSKEPASLEGLSQVELARALAEELRGDAPGTGRHSVS